MAGEQNYVNPTQEGPIAPYLLGLAPMPPLRGQDIAVAHLNRALNSGAFAHPGSTHQAPPTQYVSLQDLQPGQTVPTNRAHQENNCKCIFLKQERYSTNVDESSASESRRLEVRILCTGDQPTKVTIYFELDIPPADFLSRVCANLDVTLDSAKLGWKSNDDTKRDPYHRLKTADDVTNAFRVLGGHLKNPRRTGPVYMEIANLVSCFFRLT